MKSILKSMQGYFALSLIIMVAGLSFSSASYALKADRAEFSLYIPYAHGDVFKFKGGAEVDFSSDAGFGFGFSYNVTRNFAARADIGWNSVGYDATRVLDDNGSPVDQYLSGRMDTFNLGFGGEYYFTTGKVAPFVVGNFGWSTLDTNISNGQGGTVCWWDPWWGYVCDSYRSTFSDTSYYYGGGLGVRFEIGRNNFLKVSHSQNWLNVHKSTGDTTTNVTRVEFGFSY